MRAPKEKTVIQKRRVGLLKAHSDRRAEVLLYLDAQHAFELDQLFADCVDSGGHAWGYVQRTLAERRADWKSMGTLGHVMRCKYCFKRERSA